MDDEFALPDKKSKKGGKKAPEPAPEPVAGDDDAEEGGRVMTKKEKEKAKKAREQQRKKEQVCNTTLPITFMSTVAYLAIIGCRKEEERPSPVQG